MLKSVMPHNSIHFGGPRLVEGLSEQSCLSKPTGQKKTRGEFLVLGSCCSFSQDAYVWHSYPKSLKCHGFSYRIGLNVSRSSRI